MTTGTIGQDPGTDGPARRDAGAGVPPPVIGLAEASDFAGALHRTLSGVLLGAPGAVATAVLGTIAGGHLLIEDVPGVGKTVLARALSASLGVDLARIQGNPDLLPSDVTGLSVYNTASGAWTFRPGPVFSHVVLLDELNRTPPRTQSALLETMEEHQVSVDGQTWALPRPHLVIATQNPVGQLGTYPLVESQRDRFAVSTTIGYPDAETEARLLLHAGGRYALDQVSPIASAGTWHGVIEAIGTVHVAEAVARYAVALVRSTRAAPSVSLGASPRAAITLIRIAQAAAVFSGRDFVLPDDVQAVAPIVLPHRLVVDGDIALARSVVHDIVAQTPVPQG